MLSLSSYASYRYGANFTVFSAGYAEVTTPKGSSAAAARETNRCNTWTCNRVNSRVPSQHATGNDEGFSERILDLTLTSHSTTIDGPSVTHPLAGDPVRSIRQRMQMQNPGPLPRPSPAGPVPYCERHFGRWQDKDK